MKSLGGNNCCGVPTRAGPVDQQSIEQRHDVLVYTSDFLQESLEVTGPIKLKLYASSSSTETDFVAKLIDVYPDGTAINVAEGLLRTRYRKSLDQPKKLNPGKIYELMIDLVDTSNLFLKGHRIRLDVTSSHFPQFNRNLNTGEAFGLHQKPQVANQTIYHSNTYPSHFILPIIPSD